MPKGLLACAWHIGSAQNGQHLEKNPNFLAWVVKAALADRCLPLPPRPEALSPLPTGLVFILTWIDQAYFPSQGAAG